MLRFVSFEFDAIRVAVHMNSIRDIETISAAYILRTFPNVWESITGPDFGRYCKYQLINFKPWEGELSNAWDNEEESDEMFIN